MVCSGIKWIQVWANQVVHRPGDIAIFPFLGWGKRGSVRWVTCPGSLLWDRRPGVWAQVCRTLKPPTFPPAPVQFCPRWAVVPASAALAYSLKEGLWRLQGGGIKDPGWNLTAKSLLNSWLTETVWDNKSLLLLQATTFRDNLVWSNR